MGIALDLALVHVLIADADVAWPPSDVQRVGSFICFDAKQGLTFDHCCDQETYGPWGNGDCLQGIFSYELCCLPDWRKTLEIRSCDWVDFRLHAQDMLDSAENAEAPSTLAQHDAIYEEGCCVTYQAPDLMCWNHLPGMAETLLGTNISAGYASCCFDRFQALVDAQRGEADPTWLQAELEVELPQDRPRVGHEDIERVFQQRSDVLCRIRLVKTDLKVEPTSCLDNGRVHAFWMALRIFQHRLLLPENLDLLLTHKDFLMEDFGVPVFTDIRPVSMPAGRLMRFPHEFLLGIWGRVMNYKVRSAVMRYPWSSKEEVLFWRGGMTGKWICPHDGASDCSALQEVRGKQWNLTHWHLGLRGRAVLLQSFAPPGYTDIKFSSRVGMSDEVAALLTRRGWLDLDEN